MPTFGEKLHEIRNQRGMTQEQLAHEMNVSRQAVSHWEDGRAEPDLDALRHLSQVLNYNFLAVEGLSEEAQAAPEGQEISAQPMEEQAVEAPSAQTEGTPRKRKLLPVLLAAVVLCAALALCLLPRSKPSGKCANVSIASAENPVKAIRFEDFPEGVGWFYSFHIEETSGIPFTVHELTQTTYAESGYEGTYTFTSEQLAEIWGSNTLEQHISQTWAGGFPLQAVKGVSVAIKGTDANGNELEFKGYVDLSKEIAE